MSIVISFRNVLPVKNIHSLIWEKITLIYNNEDFLIEAFKIICLTVTLKLLQNFLLIRNKEWPLIKCYYLHNV